MNYSCFPLISGTPPTPSLAADSPPSDTREKLLNNPNAANETS